MWIFGSEDNIKGEISLEGVLEFKSTDVVIGIGLIVLRRDSKLLQFVDVVLVLSRAECTLTSMVKEGAMVSVATTTASDSMGVRVLPSSRDGSQTRRLLKEPTSLIS